MRGTGGTDFVAEHPVVLVGKCDPAAGQPVGGGPGPDTDHHEVGVHDGAVAQLHRGDRAGVAAHPGDSGAGAQVDSLGTVQPGH